MKQCRWCKQTKPESEFRSHSTSKDGLSHKCEACHKTNHPNESERPGQIKNRTTHGVPSNNQIKAHGRSVRNLAKYALLPADFEAWYNAQDGCCAICGEHETDLKKPLNVDHCHRKDMVRGLLCHHCNVGIGYFRDSPERLRLTAKYLDRWYDTIKYSG